MRFPDPAFPRHAALAAAAAPAMDGRDLAHDAGHLRRVYAWALCLAPEAGVDPDLAGAAALVHDLDATPKSSPERALGGERSARAADPVLAAAGYGADERAAIVAAVATSSWSRGLPPAGPLGAVLQDADRLDAIGAIGVARTFACHGAMAGLGAGPGGGPTGGPAVGPAGGTLFHDDDPWAETGRALDDRAHALDHFARKLLRLAEGMHTASAREEAAQRHAAMLAFLDALRRELP